MTTPDDELTQLRSEVDGLRAELAVLKRLSSAPVPTSRISRAGLLRAAGLAAAGAAAGAVALPAATPALADNGSNLIAGQDNLATATTSLTSSVLTDAALRVSNYYTGSIDDYSDALQAYTYGAGLAALYGRNDAAGGSGVIGYSGNGIGGTFAGGGAPLRLQPASAEGAPTTGNHQQGELYVDSSGTLWLCTADVAPGSWVEVGGSASLDLMRAYPSTGGSFASGAWVKVPLDTTSGDAQRAYDPHGNFDTTNHRFTAPAAGYYRIAAQVLFNINASSVVVAAIYRNGSALLYGPQFPTTSSYTIGASTISDVVYLASGDYIELWGVQNSGATKAVNNNATDTYLSVQRVA